MKQFLTIVLREQFTLFYRCGYTYIPNLQLLEFDGEFSNETDNSIIELFSKLTPFDWDEEYLILQLEKDKVDLEKIATFEIQDLLAIFPLSQQAKTSIESKTDRRIRLENPVFERILPKIEEVFEKRQVEQAIKAVWSICKFDDDSSKYVSEIGIRNIFKGLEHRKTGRKTINIHNGSYWEYLIAYDRIDYFPNSILGFFYDAGQIFAQSTGLPTFEGSGLHKSLEQLNSSDPDIKIKEIIAHLEADQLSKSYISKTTVADLKQYLVAPIYLMLRDDLRKAEDFYQTKLHIHLKSLLEFGDSFKYSLILLGAFFGFKGFYDAYYNTLNLRFYKTFKSIPEKDRTPGVDAIQEEKASTTISKTDRNSIIVKQESNIKPLQTGIKNHKEEDKEELNSIAPNNQIENKIDSEVLNEESVLVKKCKDVINQILEKEIEAKISEIKKQINILPGQKVTSNAPIINVINKMDNVQYFKKKNTDMVRRSNYIQQDLYMEENKPKQ